MSTSNAFKLSRLYAKGWAAGTEQSSDQTDSDLDAAAEALNPGKTPAERTRWREGFVAAVERNRDRPARKLRAPHAPNASSFG